MRAAGEREMAVHLADGVVELCSVGEVQAHAGVRPDGPVFPLEAPAGNG